MVTFIQTSTILGFFSLQKYIFGVLYIFIILFCLMYPLQHDVNKYNEIEFERVILNL